MTKVFLIILDGWGWSPLPEGNLLLETETPGLDTLFALGGWTLLRTASLEVGLPWGSVGDSELGHYNIGTGRIVVRRGGAKPELVEIHARGSLVNDGADLVADISDTNIREHKSLETPVSLGSTLAGYGLTQVKIASSHKLDVLSHAFNGYPKQPLAGETIVEYPAATDPAALLEAQPALLDNDLVVINLPEADGAAHLGDMRQLRQAIQETDGILQHLAAIALKQQAVLYVTADHGNIEQMLDINGHADTNHTTSPVVLLRVDFRHHRSLPTFASHFTRKRHIAVETPSGLLADIAPTILEDFRLPAPAAMIGVSLQRILKAR